MIELENLSLDALFGCVPANVVDNRELCTALVGAAKAESIVKSTGFAVRRVLEPGRTVLDLMLPAARRALTADNGAWSGDMTILSGGVLVSNLTALGTGRIKMHPRTALIVAVSYKDAGQSLKEKVIDRIEVQNPDNLAESDLWVSFQVQGEGLRNDVDFSAQPYLWLSAPKSRQGWQNDYQTLDGVFTPCGDTYRFGYNYPSLPVG